MHRARASARAGGLPILERAQEVSACESENNRGPFANFLLHTDRRTRLKPTGPPAMAEDEEELPAPPPSVFAAACQGDVEVLQSILAAKPTAGASIRGYDG